MEVRTRRLLRSRATVVLAGSSILLRILALARLLHSDFGAILEGPRAAVAKKANEADRVKETEVDGRGGHWSKLSGFGMSCEAWSSSTSSRSSSACLCRLCRAALERFRPRAA